MTLNNETERSYSYDVSMDMLNGDGRINTRDLKLLQAFLSNQRSEEARL